MHRPFGSRITLIGLILSLANAAAALDPSRLLTQYIHRNWQTAQGLPQITVRGLAQTGDGFLWVGTEEGLARLDGMQFRIYSRQNTSGIRNHHVISLSPSVDGGLWIGTYQGGVSEWQGGFFRPLPCGKSPEGLSVRVILQDRAGRVWIGSMGQGLFRYDRKGLVPIPLPVSGAAATIRAFCEDDRGALWVGTEGSGIFVETGGGFEPFAFNDRLPSANVLALLQDRQKTLWIGTARGLVAFREGRLKHYSEKDGLMDSYIRCLLEDRDGGLWVGTNSAGIQRFLGGIVGGKSAIPLLARDAVMTMLEDREGNLWVGTVGSGLHLLADAFFVPYGTLEGLGHPVVWSVLQTRAGDFWLGTPEGLIRFDPDQSVHFQRVEGVPAPMVYGLCEDRKGRLWVGTNGGGIGVRAGERWTYHSTANGLPHNKVFCILQGRDGMIWAATQGGVGRWNGRQWRQWDNRDGLPDAKVNVLHEDRRGDLWVGCQTGLAVIRNEQVRTFRARQGSTPSDIRDIHQDASGALWFGTYGGGIWRYQGGTFRSCDVKDGLVSDTIFRILEDDRGFFWLSSNKGLIRIASADLNAFMDGKTTSISCRSFGTGDGMRSGECIGVCQPAGWRAADGRLWFATAEGVVGIDPKRADRAPIVAPVHIESLKVDRVAGDVRQGTAFPPGRGEVEIGYTAIHFVDPAAVTFRYRIRGFEEEWMEVGSRREAYFTNLPPGRFIFEVAARVGDGPYGTPASLEFVLKPRFHQTAWFYMLLALVAGGLAWSLHRLRVGVLKARSALLNERNRIAQEMHDSVAQGIVGITIQLNAAQEKWQSAPETGLQHLHKAIKLAADTLEETRRAIWALRPSAAGKVPLSEALREIAAKTFGGPPPSWTVEVEGQPCPLRLDAELNLLRIGQEGMNNIQKHAQAQCVNIRLIFGRGEVVLHIRDDGRGFDAHQPSAGGLSGKFGLSMMRQRALQISATLDIRSHPGEGTEIRVTVPVRSKIARDIRW